MKKRFNLYHLFLEEKEQVKLSAEKSAEIWKIIEAFFHAANNTQQVLPTDEEVE